jgi:hypothetical protein
MIIFSLRDFIYLCLEENRLTHILKNQITRLVITIADVRTKYLMKKEELSIFTHILTVFSNIRYLKLYSPSDFYNHELSFDDHFPTFFSSTLMEFHVSVLSFNDCLYLLDGRFNQLHTLHVTISWFSSSQTMINNKVSHFMRIR